ncbi:hypothetical protein OROMI_029410 [Orobanche minor]
MKTSTRQRPSSCCQIFGSAFRQFLFPAPLLTKKSYSSC